MWIHTLWKTSYTCGGSPIIGGWGSLNVFFIMLLVQSICRLYEWLIYIRKSNWLPLVEFSPPFIFFLVTFGEIFLFQSFFFLFTRLKFRILLNMIESSITRINKLLVLSAFYAIKWVRGLKCYIIRLNLLYVMNNPRYMLTWNEVLSLRHKIGQLKGYVRHGEFSHNNFYLIKVK